MPKLYVAVYLAKRNFILPDDPIELVRIFSERRANCDFPYDNGDDPSFFSATYYNGPITWGVCRSDVRQNINLGDRVIFISAENIGGNIDYRLVGLLKVKKKLQHWALPVFYGRYLNQLVRRVSGGYEHYEPGLHEDDWHDDWLWRMSARRYGFKQTLVKRGRKHVLKKLYDDDKDISRGNYVVFSSDDKIVFDRPIKVASFTSGDKSERWVDSPAILDLKNHLLGNSNRNLRIQNKYRPHRHIVIDIDELWVERCRGIMHSILLAIPPLPTGVLSI